VIIKQIKYLNMNLTLESPIVIKSRFLFQAVFGTEPEPYPEPGFFCRTEPEPEPKNARTRIEPEPVSENRNRTQRTRVLLGSNIKIYHSKNTYNFK
jgi:hypothetical protein